MVSINFDFNSYQLLIGGPTGPDGEVPFQGSSASNCSKLEMQNRIDDFIVNFNLQPQGL